MKTNFLRLILLFCSLVACSFVRAENAENVACPRIVSQSPYLTQALEWLGRGDCLVGVSRYDQLRPALPRTGGVLDPDAEAIAALQPELIVTSNWADEALLNRITPASAKRLTVDGFRSMQDAEAMLAALAEASGASDAQTKIDAFSRDWRQVAERIAPIARKRRLLVLSTCMGNPLSFGRDHVIGDVFAQSGFSLVETAPKVRHLVEGADIPDVKTLLETTRPEIIVALTNESAEFCRMIAPQIEAEVLTLDGAPFIHPGPGLLKAFEEIEAAFPVP